MNKKTIGNKYDAQKFERIIEELTNELVSKTMTEETDSEKILILQKQASDNLRQSISELPIIFYQTIDAFADGKNPNDYITCKDPRESDLIKDMSFISLVMACHDGKVSVKNEKAARNYYESLFGTSKEKITVNSPSEVANNRYDAIEQGRVEAEEYLRKNDEISSLQTEAVRKANMKGKELSIALDIVKQNTKLARLTALVIEMTPLKNAELMNDSEKKQYRKLTEAVQKQSLKVEQKKNKFFIINDKKLKSESITAEESNRRKAIFESENIAQGDASLRSVEETNEKETRERDSEPNTSPTIVRKQIDFKDKKIFTKDIFGQSPVATAQGAIKKEENEIESGNL